MNSVPYYKMLVLICFPFVYCGILAFFWIAYKFYSKKSVSDILESLLITISITFFFFQSNAIKTLADLLNCTKIENNMRLTNYLLEKCIDNPNYEFWRNFVIIPSFCFFSLVLTLIPFIYMCKNRKKLYTENALRKIGFLLNGYSPQYFYWFKKKHKIF